jgi:hypothetical protein
MWKDPWQLRHGDEVVAVLVPLESDQPWLIGRIEPTERFEAEFRPLFDADYQFLEQLYIDVQFEDWKGVADIARKLHTSREQMRSALSLLAPDGERCKIRRLHIAGSDVRWSPGASR